jgi:exodeoxyribonuclease-5
VTDGIDWDLVRQRHNERRERESDPTGRNDDDDGGGYEQAKRKMGILTRMEISAENDDEKSAQFSSALTLSDEQASATDDILEWFKRIYADNQQVHVRPVFALGGYAGTGKTTLLGFLAAMLCKQYRVAFCTITGKAASVLQRSLRANGVRPEYCGTIHRMMYVPDVDEDTGEVKGWLKAPDLPYDLVVVDEASMLPAEILSDMKAFSVPILAVGDHGQLPPVGEDVSLMQNPDARLEVVRRQALDNPIIALSVIIREGGDWRGFVKSCGDPRVSRIDRDEVNMLVMERFTDFAERSLLDDPLILCGTNRTRAGLNKAARFALKTTDLLIPGDRVICLKNAYFDQMMLANGFRGRVTGLGHSSHPLQMKAHVEFPDEGLELRYGVMCKAQFARDKTFRSFKEVNEHNRSWNEVGMLFDYGYALTVHKAQGSQADEAILVVERFMGDEGDFRRWLYTGATRASQRLTLVM